MPTRREWANKQLRLMGTSGDPNWSNPDWVDGYREGLATAKRAAMSLTRDLAMLEKVVDQYIEDRDADQTK